MAKLLELMRRPAFYFFAFFLCVGIAVAAWIYSTSVQPTKDVVRTRTRQRVDTESGTFLVYEGFFSHDDKLLGMSLIWGTSGDTLPRMTTLRTPSGIQLEVDGNIVQFGHDDTEATMVTNDSSGQLINGRVDRQYVLEMWNSCERKTFVPSDEWTERIPWR